MISPGRPSEPQPQPDPRRAASVGSGPARGAHQPPRERDGQDGHGGLEGSAGASDDGSTDGDAGPDAASVLDDLRGLGVSLGRLALLRWEQVRLAAGESLSRLGLCIFALLATLAAVWFLVRALVSGVAGGLAAWTGRAWLGELLTGALGLFALVLVWVLSDRARDARARRRLERRFGPEPEPETRPRASAGEPRA